MNEIQETYRCVICGEEWTFEMTDYLPEDYPDTCPLCSMPISQMIRDIYVKEGVWAVLKHLWIRVIKGKIR